MTAIMTVIADMMTDAFFVAAQAPYEYGWHMHPMWGWGWGIGMMGMMFFFWAVVIVAAIVGMRWYLRQSESSHSDSAMKLLRERFARGEIDKDEFEAKKASLK